MNPKDKVRNAVQAHVDAEGLLRTAHERVVEGEKAVKTTSRDLLRVIHTTCPGKVLVYQGRQYVVKADGTALEVTDLPDNVLSLD